MGLLTIIRKNRLKSKEMRLLILGLDNAGKTTILKKVMGEPTDTIAPTLGFNIETFIHNQYKLNVWDVGGQKSLRSYWKNYFESTEGLIFVVDATDTSRLEICFQELQTLLEQERLAGATLLVLANKQDVQGALDCKVIAEILQLDKIDSHHWKILPCSAVTGDNLYEGFDWLVEDIGSRIYMLD